MIRIFPDFSVQVTASAGGGPGVGGSGGGGGMVTGPPVGRVPVPVPVPGAANGTPQSVQGIGGYPQRYLWSRSGPAETPSGVRSRPAPLSLHIRS